MKLSLEKLKSTISACLITDLKTNTLHKDFIALGATLTDSNLINRSLFL